MRAAFKKAALKINEKEIYQKIYPDFFTVLQLLVFSERLPIMHAYEFTNITEMYKMHLFSNNRIDSATSIPLFSLYEMFWQRCGTLQHCQ